MDNFTIVLIYAVLMLIWVPSAMSYAAGISYRILLAQVQNQSDQARRLFYRFIILTVTFGIVTNLPIAAVMVHFPNENGHAIDHVSFRAWRLIFVGIAFFLSMGLIFHLGFQLHYRFFSPFTEEDLKNWGEYYKAGGFRKRPEPSPTLKAYYINRARLRYLPVYISKDALLIPAGLILALLFSGLVLTGILELVNDGLPPKPVVLPPHPCPDQPHLNEDVFYAWAIFVIFVGSILMGALSWFANWWRVRKWQRQALAEKA